MNNPRRVFLNQISLMAGTAALCKPLASAAAITKRINTFHSAKNAVTIYHTNDLRGNVDALYKNVGGITQIKTELKNQETGGLLLDAGNFINGSNSVSQQRQVIAMMNTMGYHAAGIGAQELSQGHDHLASLTQLMNFSLVNCNYEFNNNLQRLVKPYIIINSGSFRIGITGVGSQFNGVKYNDAIQSANKVARLLKNEEKCDLVICLSHLGSISDNDKLDNHKLAAQSENIDMIIGSNNNKLHINSKILHNKLKHEVILAQTAWNGLMMGRTIINFDSDKQKNGLKAKHFIPGTSANSFAASFSKLQLAENLPLAV
jgi:5'-nucleotidase